MSAAPPRTAHPPSTASLASGSAGDVTLDSGSTARARVAGRATRRSFSTAATLTAATDATTTATLDVYKLHYAFVEEHLRAKARALDRCNHVFFYLVFLACFCLYFLYDLDAAACSQMRHSLLDTLSRSPRSPLKSVSYLEDVTDAQKYGEYVVNVVAPLVTDLMYPTGSNLVLGAMRLRTQRSRSSSECGSGVAGADLMNLYHSLDCTGSAAADSLEDTGTSNTLYSRESSWHYYSCKELGGSTWLRLVLFLQSYDCGGFLFDVPMWVNRSTSLATGFPESHGSFGDSTATSSSSQQQQLPPTLGTAEQGFPFTEGALPYERVSLQVVQEDYLRPTLWDKSAPFLDDHATRVVMTELVFYSPPLQRLAAVKVVGEVSRGGAWRATAVLTSARPWTLGDVRKGTYNTAVMALALVWIGRFIRDLVVFIRRRTQEERFVRRVRSDAGGVGGPVSYTGWMTGVVAFLEFFGRPWNLMTLAILCLMVTTGSFRVAAVLHSALSLPTLDGMINSDRYPIEVEYLMLVERVQLYLNSIILIMLFYRALYYVAVASQAARAIRVLVRAQSALLGYCALAALLLAAFAIALSAQYGSTVWDFRSVDVAFGTLLCVLMRQHSMADLTRTVEDRAALAFALLAFGATAGLCVVNLCVGIVVHAFAEVRNAEPTTATEAYQTRWLMRRAVQCLRQPREWPRYVWRWCRGHGDSALLRYAARSLRYYRAARYPVLDHVADELGHLLDRREFEEAMRFYSDVADAGDETELDTASGDGVDTDSAGAAAAKKAAWGVREDGSAEGKTPPGASTATTTSAGTATMRGSGGPAHGRRARPSTVAEARERRRAAWQQRWSGYAPAEMWRDVMADWMTSTMSEASLKYREEHVWLRDGVQSAIGDRLALVKEFPQRLEDLERKLATLESHVLENELTDAAASSSTAPEDRDDAAPPSLF